MVIRSPYFVDEYQGRVYADDEADAIGKNGKLETRRLLELVSVPYRMYMEDPDELKRIDKDMFKLIERAIK